MTQREGLAIVALTQRGCRQAQLIRARFEDRPVCLYLPRRYATVPEEGYDDFDQVVVDVFSNHEGILFIMATGIVVRKIAPLLVSKDQDPAVLVMDEAGEHIISLISGHLGGANELTRRLATVMGADPVITTASDVSHKMAVDMLAIKYGWDLKDLKGAKDITALLVNDEPVALVDPQGYLKEDTFPDVSNPKGVLVVSSNRYISTGLPFVQLIPKDLILGVGCRKGTPSESVIKAMEEVFKEHGLMLEALALMATVDVKAEEPGLLKAAAQMGIALQIFTKDQLRATEHQFVQSEFVKKTIGTGAVAEPCGYLASGQGRLLVPKTIRDGVTLSIWRRSADV
jgi:cobalt-precorrin 5A hydrolase